MKADPAEILNSQIDAGAIAGVVGLIASTERVLNVNALGKADIATSRPMQPDTIFWIASNTKPITGALLMMLVDEGKLSLDDPIKKYLPAFEGQMRRVDAEGGLQVLRPSKTDPTIRQAMCHTAGFEMFSRAEKTIDLYPLDECAMAYAMSPLLYEPNTKYSYSNCGINIGGRIIEMVSGIPYEQFLSQRLLEPLGMHDTTFVLTESQQARLATAYKLNEAKTELLPSPISQLRYPLTMKTRTACPAGGLFSTAADVAQFGRMILNGGELDGRRYLSRQSLRIMTSTQTGTLNQHTGPASGYGIGWETFATENDHDPGSHLPGRCGHGGALSNHLDIDPTTGLVTVFLVQQSGWKSPEAEQMRRNFCSESAKKFGKAIPV